MKKLISLVGAVAVTAALLSSCVEGSNTSTVSGFGVVDYYSEAGTVVVYQADDVKIFPPLYSPGFLECSFGDCVFYNGTIDYDDPVNQGDAKYFTLTNGYVVNKLDNTGQFVSRLDTATLYTNEIVTSSAGILPYSFTEMSFTNRNYLFFYSGHENVKSDQLNTYQLQYDINQEPTVSDGKRVYDFFLRVIKTQDGKGTSGSYAFNYTFNTNNYFKILQQKELEAGGHKLYVRFNFVSKIDETTKAITWSKSDIYETYLPGKNTTSGQK